MFKEDTCLLMTIIHLVTVSTNKIKTFPGWKYIAYQVSNNRQAMLLAFNKEQKVFAKI
jgi:hypothetical protein